MSLLCPQILLFLTKSPSPSNSLQNSSQSTHTSLPLRQPTLMWLPCTPLIRPAQALQAQGGAPASVLVRWPFALPRSFSPDSSVALLSSPSSLCSNMTFSVSTVFKIAALLNFSLPHSAPFPSVPLSVYNGCTIFLYIMFISCCLSPHWGVGSGTAGILCLCVLIWPLHPKNSALLTGWSQWMALQWMKSWLLDFYTPIGSL